MLILSMSLSLCLPSGCPHNIQTDVELSSPKFDPQDADLDPRTMVAGSSSNIGKGSGRGQSAEERDDMTSDDIRQLVDGADGEASL